MSAVPDSSNILILGGGLAGIAAAVRLAERGRRVTLIETRKRLGGRATSFTDPATGELLDNCQHVVMRCCTNLLDLYARLGVADRIEWHRTFYFLDGRGNLDTLEGDDLPAPAHLGKSILAFKTFSLRDKFAISMAMSAIMRTRRAEWHSRSFGDWLREHRQPAGVIEKFWSPVIISALNETPDRAAADYALQVFQEGFLANNTAYEMGLSAVPLVQLYDAAEKAVGDVRLGTSADSLVIEGKRISAVRLSNGETLAADWIISTVPFDRLLKLCPPEVIAADARLQSLDRIDVSPILGIHLWFDRPVMNLPHVSLTQSPLQWLFNKGISPPPDSPHKTAQYLHGVISAAHDWVDLPADEILTRTVAEVRKAFPHSAGATLIHGRVIKEKRATFSLAPGLDRFRAATTGSIDNLILAGDWTLSGWPATMEGAVRSGYLAAGAILGENLIIPDLPASGLYRLLSGT